MFDPPTSIPSGDNATGSKISSLSIANDGAPLDQDPNTPQRVYSGQLDLGNSDMVIDYAAHHDPFSGVMEDVRQALESGFNGGTWTGQGIVSSMFQDGNPNQLDKDVFGIGYTLNEIVPIAYNDTDRPFFGIPVDSSAPLIKFTWVGDLNLDGFVDFQDISVFNTNFDNGATSERFWWEGDFNYDGKIDFQDLSLFNTQYDPSKPSMPEPGALALLAPAVIGLLARRRRGK